MDTYAFASRPDAADTIDSSDSSSRGPGAAGVAGLWVTACLLGLLAAGASVAAPGELDPTFGDGGRAHRLADSVCKHFDRCGVKRAGEFEFLQISPGAADVVMRHRPIGAAGRD